MSPVVVLGGLSTAGSEAAEPTVLPRRLVLGLDELLVLARMSGDLRLPLHLPAPSGADTPRDRLAARLSGGTAAPEQEAESLIAGATAAAADDGPDGAAARLTDAGLLHDGTPPGELRGALEVLDHPEVLVTLDLTVARRGGEVALRAWFAAAAGAVVQLATVGGLRYELGWFGLRDWSAALARAVDVGSLLPASAGPPAGDAEPDALSAAWSIPHELLLSGAAAVRDRREDLLDELLRMHTGTVRDEHGDAVDDLTARTWLTRLESGTLGRMHLTVASVHDERTAGVLSWLLLEDGWHELRARVDQREHVVDVRRVAPADLGRRIAPLVGEVLS